MINWRWGFHYLSDLCFRKFSYHSVEESMHPPLSLTKRFLVIMVELELMRQSVEMIIWSRSDSSFTFRLQIRTWWSPTHSLVRSICFVVDIISLIGKVLEIQNEKTEFNDIFPLVTGTYKSEIMSMIPKCETYNQQCIPGTSQHYCVLF